MTDALREAAQQALEALVHHTDQTRPIQRTADAIAALRAALAAPPVDPGRVLVPVELLNLCESMVKLHDRHGCILTVDMEVMTNLLMLAAAPADSTARDVWNDRAALAQPAVSGEPVAHVSECEACFTPDACQLRGTCDHYAAEKLRIAAAPQPAPARVPLTDEQINRITIEQWGAGLGAPYAAYRAYARAIEATHGITTKEAP